MEKSIYLIINSLALLWCIILSNRMWVKTDKTSFEKSKWLRHFITGLTVFGLACGIVWRIQSIEGLGVPSVLEVLLYGVAAMALGTGMAVVVYSCAFTGKNQRGCGKR